MEIAFILVIGLMVLAVGAYFFLMIFFPEWVGITGKEAKRTLDDHKEGNASKDPRDLF